MNIQTERLENHTTRLTVEIETERLEKAKRAAAKKIARQVNIPGFRKGKAPYNIILRNFGEATVLNDAVEDLSQDIYREALESSEDIQPYGPGAWEDFKLEPSPTFIYTVPLQPTVELNDYREVRLEYEEPEVEDEMVDRAMEQLREQEALVEESSQPVELNNRLTLDIHSEFADDPPQAEVAEDEDAAEAEADAGEGDEANEEESDEVDDRVPNKGDHFIHEHDATVRLNPDDEPILPGFNDALVGANVDDELEFELDVPEDLEGYEDIAGRKIHFHVTVKKVEVVTLPELNDELAAKVTAEEDEPLSLLELRMRMRENLQQEMERRAKDEYAGKVLDKMVEQATISFPDAMVEEQIDGMIQEFEQRLRQQGMDLNTFISVTGQSMEDVRAQYREPAINNVRRSLVLGEISQAENIMVKDAQIESRIDEMLQQFGAQAESLRSLFDTPDMRGNIANELLSNNVLERLILIARGMEIPDEAEEEAQEETGDKMESVVEDAVFADVEASSEADSAAEEAAEESTAEETEATADEDSNKTE